MITFTLEGDVKVKLYSLIDILVRTGHYNHIPKIMKTSRYKIICSLSARGCSCSIFM